MEFRHASGVPPERRGASDTRWEDGMCRVLECFGRARRARRFRAGALAATLLAAMLVAVGWHVSDMILGPDAPPTLHEQRVLAVGSGRVKLSRDRESLQPGTWGLQWEDGFGWVGRVMAIDAAGVEREFRPMIGTPPPGGWASLCGVSRSADPRSLLGMTFTGLSVPGPCGDYPAWFVPGHDSTWVIYVHGRAANRAEGLRTLGALRERGMPGLLITYRNDPEAPRSPDGRYHLGLTEWQDLESAVSYALAHGARDVVIAGYSMGGQVALQFLAHSRLAGRVRGVVLESPTLDWRAVLAQRGRVLHVPAAATWIGEQAASLRAGLDWGQLDRLRHERGITTPILLFHCVHDRFAPVARSEAFARALPSRVTLVLVAGGNHVDAWNADPAAYATRLNAWFDRLGAGRVPS